MRRIQDTVVRDQAEGPVPLDRDARTPADRKPAEPSTEPPAALRAPRRRRTSEE